MKHMFRKAVSIVFAAVLLTASFGASGAAYAAEAGEAAYAAEAGEAANAAEAAAEESGANIAATANETETGNEPVIALTYVPARGLNSPVTGVVFKEGGDFNPSDYRISVFLQIEEGGQYWVKPYNTKPYTELGDDGSFSALFNTGGNDINAKILHIMLIPSSFTPSIFALTKDNAIDYVKVTRSEGTSITIEPNREAPEPPHVQPAIKALLPVSKDKIAVDVGFYTNGSWPGSPLSEDLIRQQLTAVAAFSDTVRFYSAGGELSKAYKIAHDMGFKVVGTAYLCGKKTEDKAELDALIEQCNSGYVQVACVGNETLLETAQISPKLKAPELISYINYVREHLKDSSIPVSTSDSVDVLLANSSVRNACNLIMPNCYPYWGGTVIDNAAQAFINSISALKAVSGGKQILVSETGWPTDGQTVGSAVPGEANAAQYFEKIREWSLSTGTQVLYFDAADEPWKSGAGQEGPSGAHWGFMTRDFKVKAGYEKSESFRKLLVPGASKKVTAKNVASGIKLTWEKVPGATSYHVYRGSKRLGTTSKLELTDQEVKLSAGKKYTYKVVATRKGIGDSPKARTATMYRLLPVGIKTVANTAAGKMTVTYDSGKVCSGYVVRYGLKSDMSDAKVITVKGAETTSRTFSGLTKGKTYYVQVRTYMIDNGTRYYSGYCTTKTVKIVK